MIEVFLATSGVFKFLQDKFGNCFEKILCRTKELARIVSCPPESDELLIKCLSSTC